MGLSNPLAALEATERNQLETLLMEFDQAWNPLRLNEFGSQLESAPSVHYRRLAMVELVKIDLQRRWASGQGKLLEEYLAQFPELGTVESIDPEVILVEFVARQSIEPNLDLASYAARFPAQYQQVARLASQARDSHLASDAVTVDPGPASAQQSAQASVDTSRVDAARDTRTDERGIGQKKAPDGLPVEFGRYRILRELGSGAMGTVFLAHDTQLDRQVALKTPSFKGDKDKEQVARFYREARSAAKIQHRNICPVYDVGEIAGRHFISMAFVKGRSMSEYITPTKLPPPKTSAILIHRLATALAEAHRHNVIHRDLKPANVMIDMKREPVVMDFGLARQTDSESRMTQSGMIVGTPAYMSPEQLSGDPNDVGPSADIYALGVMLYELLTGKLPFRGTIATVVYKIVHEAPTAPSKLRSGLDPELEAICMKMMAKDRATRFASMDEVATALKGYVTSVRRKARGATDKSPETQADSKSPSPAPKVDRGDANVAVTSNAQGLVETDALNAFFAAKAAADPQHTAIDPVVADAPSSDLPPSDPLALSSSPKTPSSQGSGRHGNRNALRKWIGTVLAGGFMLVLGIAFLVRTPHGTIRIETVGNLDGLEVRVDGSTISLTQTETVAATDHELSLKLNGSELQLDPKTNQFVVVQNGTQRRLTVSVGDVQLSSKLFTVAKNGETLLRIELLDDVDEMVTSSATNAFPETSPIVSLPSSRKPPSDATEFTSLLNGRDLTGWTVMGADDWHVSDGVLVGDHQSGKPGWLMSDAEYEDFELRLEYKLAVGGNSGVFFRAWPTGDKTGSDFHEIQLVDDNADRHAHFNDTQRNASLYGEIAARPILRPPSGQWHRLTISVTGNHLLVRVNDQQVIDDLLPSDKQARGHIGFQLHQSRVEFRNIRIREIIQQSSDPPGNAGASETLERQVAARVQQLLQFATDVLSELLRIS